MLAKKTNEPQPSKSKISIKASTSMINFVVLIGVLIFVVMVIFFICKSFAITPLDKWDRHIRWFNNSRDYITPGVTSTNGWLCVGTMFNNNQSQEYYWVVDVWSGSSWKKTSTSKKYHANGNVDQACLNSVIKQNAIYRVRFITSSPTSMDGWTWVNGNSSHLPLTDTESPQNN